MLQWNNCLSLLRVLRRDCIIFTKKARRTLLSSLRSCCFLFLSVHIFTRTLLLVVYFFSGTLLYFSRHFSFVFICNICFFFLSLLSLFLFSLLCSFFVGIVHRDLAARNVLLSESEHGFEPVITDLVEDCFCDATNCEHFFGDPASKNLLKQPVFLNCRVKRAIGDTEHRLTFKVTSSAQLIKKLQVLFEFKEHSTVLFAVENSDSYNKLPRFLNEGFPTDVKLIIIE